MRKDLKPPENDGLDIARMFCEFDMICYAIMEVYGKSNLVLPPKWGRGVKIQNGYFVYFLYIIHQIMIKYECFEQLGLKLGYIWYFSLDFKIN